MRPDVSSYVTSSPRRRDAHPSDLISYSFLGTRNGPSVTLHYATTRTNIRINISTFHSPSFSLYLSLSVQRKVCSDHRERATSTPPAVPTETPKPLIN